MVGTGWTVGGGGQKPTFSLKFDAFSMEGGWVEGGGGGAKNF